MTTQGATANDASEGFCVLLKDGTVACWGANGAGQLGRGDDAGATDSASPARVVGLTDIVRLDHTCALDKEGGVWCWGTGPYLKGDGAAITTERTPVKLPVPSATLMSIGTSVGCVVADDEVLCWGNNSFAQLAPLNVVPATAVLSPRRIDLPPGDRIRDIAVANATFILRDGDVSAATLVTWGATPPLGRVSSLIPDPYPSATGLRGVTSIDMVIDNACAVAGAAGYCWGVVRAKFYESPEVGMFDHALPERVDMSEPVVQIATTRTTVTTGYGDAIVQPQRWCAVGASGDVYCWGDNQSGQAGDGTNQHAFAPIRVRGLSVPAAQVKTTSNATCALLVDGKVYCWGANNFGQLGHGRLKAPSSVPQEVVLP